MLWAKLSSTYFLFSSTHLVILVLFPKGIASKPCCNNSLLTLTTKLADLLCFTFNHHMFAINHFTWTIKEGSSKIHVLLTMHRNDNLNMKVVVWNIKSWTALSFI